MASVEIMLRFKEKNGKKKNKKAAFAVAWMKFLLNFQAQKTTQEGIIVERFSYQVRQPSFLRQSTQLLVSFTKKVYDIIHIEVGRMKLELSTSVASSSSKAETHAAGEERDKVFYRFGGAAPNRVIKPRKQTLTLDG